MISEEQINRIRERYSKTTQGAWDTFGTLVYSNEGMICEISEPRQFDSVRHEKLSLSSPHFNEAAANAHFIAHSRDDIKDLLDEVDRLRDENSLLKQGGGDPVSENVKNISIAVEKAFLSSEQPHPKDIDVIMTELRAYWRLAYEHAKLKEFAKEFIEYRDRNTLNFQLEKADVFINEMRFIVSGDYTKPPTAMPRFEFIEDTDADSKTEESE